MTALRNKLAQFLTVKIFLLLSLLSLVAVKLVYAHGGENSDAMHVRVIAYNPSTYEYTIQCSPPNKTSASQITPEKFYAIDPVPPHHFGNRSFRSTLNITTWRLDPNNFDELVHTNAMYHMYCEVQNFSALAGQQNIASEFHVDLRTTHNQNDPNIYVIDSEGPRATLKCDPPPGVKDYSLSWKLRSRAGTTSFPELNNKRIVNITAPKASAGWDVVCDVADKRTGKFYHWDMPIEFFDEGPAYIPTIEGCVHDKPCYQVSPDGIVPNGDLIVNVSFKNAPVQADIYINEVFKGTTSSNGMLIINNIIPGIYNLVIKKAGLEELSTLIPIAAGKQLYRSYALQENSELPSCSPTTEVCDSKDNDCDGLIDENNVCGQSTNCFSNVQNIPSTCEGTISSDSMQGTCRVINCNSGANSMQVKACDKPDSTTPKYFEMYRQSFTVSPLKICIGSSCIKNEGYIKSPDYPICTSTDPTCTPSTETCDGKDNDCDGQVDENNVCGTSTSCFSNVQNIPSTCEGTISSDSMQGGCRVINCNNGANSMQIKACDKPDSSAPQFFEMYRQTFSGTPLKVCIGNSCIKNEGYVKSQSYPICTGTTPPPTCTPATETCNAKDDDCDGQIDENNVCSTTSNCFSKVQNIPATCTGGSIVQDTDSGCRTIICSNGGNFLRVLACNKPDGSLPQFFEMYRQSFAGSIPKICIGNYCIQLNGYAKSSNYPICT